MAILATSRKWLVTSPCAASRSPCSRQLLASMYSSCGSSIGNRLISSRFLGRPVSPDRTGKAAVWAMTAPFPCSRPRLSGGRYAVASAKPTARYISHPQHTRSDPASGSYRGITSARRRFDQAQAAEVRRNRLSKPLFIARISPNGRQHIMQTGKIARQFRAEPQDFSGNGVFDRQDIGMQSLSAKGRQRVLRRLRQKRRFGPKSRPVNLIAHQGMTDRGQMDPDLMGPAVFEPASQQAGYGCSRTTAFRSAGIALLAAISLQHLPMRHRLPPPFANRHAIAGDLVPVDRPVDRAARAVRCAPDESQIAALEPPSIAAMARELIRQAFVSAVV